MGEFQQATQAAVTQAEAWANESAKFWLGTYVSMVERAADGTGKAGDVVRDTAKVSLAAQRDAARVVTTWVTIGTALVDLEIK